MTFWQDLGNALLEAFFWFLEGLLGTLQVAARVRTDVPWYQCLASQAIVIANALLVGLLVKTARERKERRKGLERVRRGDF